MKIPESEVYDDNLKNKLGHHIATGTKHMHRPIPW